MSSPSKSCILDPLPASLLKDNVDVLTPYVDRIPNLSISSRMVARDLKIAIVTPLLKKQNLDPFVLKNFRPVSRILEKIVLRQCQSCLKQNNLFYVRQLTTLQYFS